MTKEKIKEIYRKLKKVKACHDEMRDDLDHLDVTEYSSLMDLDMMAEEAQEYVDDLIVDLEKLMEEN